MKLDPNSVVALVSLAVGVLGVPVVQLIKKYTHWEDGQALACVMGVSIILSGLVAVANGLFAGAFDPQKWVDSCAVVLSTSMVIYRAFVKKPEPLPEG